MRRVKISQMPSRLSDYLFDDKYSGVNDHWESKNRKLEARRWRQMKQQTI